MSGFLTSVEQNIIFLLEFFGVILVIFLLAYLTEKWDKKITGDRERILSTRKISMIGMLSALSAILIIFGEVPIPFLAPDFYKIDLSELPALLGAFALGPVAGVMIELCKILLKLAFKPTTTAFVGELANFAVSCTFILPAAVLYQRHKTKRTAFVACVIGTAIMTIFGTVFNAVYLLPKFAEMYGMPLDTIIGMGTVLNASITNLMTFVILIVAPLNLIKGILVSIITLLIYKPLSPFLKEIGVHRR